MPTLKSCALRVSLCLAILVASAASPTNSFWLGQGSALAQSTNAAEKDAFEDAKALGTVEAWDAFLSNYPSGFHADLARAYVKKLADQPAASPPAAAAAPPASAQASDHDFPIEAGSWGGIVRSGAGQSFKKLDSLAEGESVALMGVTDELDNGYPWFKIWYGPNQHENKGYMWGGILCAVGKPRSDVYQMCPAKGGAKLSKDCAKGNDAENVICGNANLTGLDTELNSQFTMRVSNITSEANGGTKADVEQFRNEQRAWLRERDACGGNLSCLEKTYNARLKILRELNQPE